MIAFNSHRNREKTRLHTDKILFKSIIALFLWLVIVTSNAQKLPTDTPQYFNFKEVKQNKASIIIFFDPECPICQKYTKLIKELNAKYTPEGIKVYIVYPFKVLDDESLASFKTEYQFNYPLIFDKKRKLLNKLKGNYSPEVFLLNNKAQTLYHGAIDNWFYGLGKNRAEPTELYLLNAIEAYKKGEEIKLKYIEPVGCML